jgi:hypothetical protein
VSAGSVIVAIVAIVAFVILRIAKYRTLGREGIVQQDRRGKHPVVPHPREAELEREVADLKKRLAVLERIATDDRQSKAIAHEIEALRDR